MKHRFTQEVPECSLEFTDQSRVSVVLSIVSVGSRSGNSLSLDNARADMPAVVNSLYSQGTPLEIEQYTQYIDDSRRHCKPIFAPTDKPNDNCVLAIPILNRAANFIFRVLRDTQDDEVTE